MQRTNLFQVKHSNDKNGNSFYRVMLLPVNPKPNYAIKYGKLSFYYYYYYCEGNIATPYMMKQTTCNQFNVQAMVAQNYQDILATAKKRNLENEAQANTLVVDIEKSFFDNADINSSKYIPKENKNFIPPFLIMEESPKKWAHFENENYSEVLFGNRLAKFFYKIPIIAEPITEQHTSFNITDSSNGTPLILNIPVQQRDNPLSKPSLHMEIYDYENGKPGFGQDIYLSQGTPLFTAAYRRNIGKLSDWCSNQQPSINKESYLDLTKSLCEEKGNASKIAELFDDYAAKGSGFSALIHFHLFRHNKNIIKAREIAKDLKQNFQHASNIEIVEYLIGKFKELESKDYTVNKEGSFARRINYAILQLTNGLCHSIEEFAAYQVQNSSTAGKKVG